MIRMKFLRSFFAGGIVLSLVTFALWESASGVAPAAGLCVPVLAVV